MTTQLKSMSFISLFIEKYLSAIGFTASEKVFKLEENFRSTYILITNKVNTDIPLTLLTAEFEFISLLDMS